MKPQLLPIQVSSVFFAAEQNSVIFRRYEFQGKEYYFSLHPELYPKNGSLDFTGRYLAVLLSIQGLENFYLAMNDSGTYVMDDESEAESYIELKLDEAIPEIDGVHTIDDATEQSDQVNEQGEDIHSTAGDVIDWIAFYNELLILPLINTAIQENKQQ